MKKRFSDQHIISILREAEAGVSARELSIPGFKSLELPLYLNYSECSQYREYLAFLNEDSTQIMQKPSFHTACAKADVNKGAFLFLSLTMICRVKH